VEILRISFAKVLHKTAALCELLAVGGDLIGSEVLTQWIERILDDLQTSALIQKRKPRSCLRTLRQPTKDWPKTKTASSKPLRKTIVFTNPKSIGLKPNFHFLPDVILLGAMRIAHTASFLPMLAECERTRLIVDRLPGHGPRRP
jgi:hypothetical protein